MLTPHHDNVKPRFTSRLKYGLLCATLAILMGVGLPMLWYLVWNGLRQSRGAQDWSLLVWMLSATVGGIAGGIGGLIAGMSTCSRTAFLAVFLTLGVAHLGMFLCFLPINNEPELFVWSTLPSSAVEFGLAFALWRLRFRHPK